LTGRGERGGAFRGPKARTPGVAQKDGGKLKLWEVHCLQPRKDIAMGLRERNMAGAFIRGKMMPSVFGGDALAMTGSGGRKRGNQNQLPSTGEEGELQLKKGTGPIRRKAPARKKGFL